MTHHLTDAILFNQPSTAEMERDISATNPLPTTFDCQTLTFSFHYYSQTHIVVSFTSKHTWSFPTIQRYKFLKRWRTNKLIQQFPRAIARYQYVITITQYDHAILTWLSQIKIFSLRWLATRSRQQQKFLLVFLFCLSGRAASFHIS